ncbi:unnamed protein product [Gongylonema pulchrum]|uniref:Uncharacterized protein n=1 Tax=Gongylonema pulchrum TaxID=637853 RepID=A0A3P6TF42_9BILA|nr:unnamed protein product [Gongylonema pulchrum]
MQKGSVVHEINGCNISNTNDWRYCLKNLKLTNPGYCVPSDVIMQNAASEMQLVNNELDCCYNSTISDNPAASHMCFYVRDMSGAASECSF